MLKEITVHSPATVANMVCGFDILGFALHEPYDIITIRISNSPGIHLRNLDSFGLSDDPEGNVTGVALLAMMRELDNPPGIEVESRKQIKPGSGIGSSAASAAGAVYALNTLLGKPFSMEKLVEFALEGEASASGAKHADNIAPVLYGGITLVRSPFPPDIIRLPVPELHVALLHPLIEVKTSEARKVLPKSVPLSKAVTQWGNIAGLVAGLYKNDMSLLARSMNDSIAEPYRKELIPGFDLVKESCMKAGALGGGISGSGPSIFMFCRDHYDAKVIESEMRKVYHATGVPFETFVTALNKEGVKTVGTKND